MKTTGFLFTLNSSSKFLGNNKTLSRGSTVGTFLAALWNEVQFLPCVVIISDFGSYTSAVNPTETPDQALLRILGITVIAD